MIILVNSSKTMVAKRRGNETMRQPQLIKQAAELNDILKQLPVEKLAKLMHLSKDLALKTHKRILEWQPTPMAAAIDTFAGDIYRGLRADTFTPDDRQYADKCLVILSGLYGAIRALDGIRPYRLELMYRLSGPGFKNLYEFWGDQIANCIPKDETIINAASEEYAKTVTQFVDPKRVVSPQFLSTPKEGGEPVFVVIHAKVARGAFAHWLITTRSTDLSGFNELSYIYDVKRSTPRQPVYVRDWPTLPMQLDS